MKTMSNFKKIFALALALVMVFSLAAVAVADDAGESDTLVYATSTVGQMFSPFFATTAYAMGVVDLNQLSLRRHGQR